MDIERPAVTSVGSRPCVICHVRVEAPGDDWGHDPLPYCGCDDKAWILFAEDHIRRFEMPRLRSMAHSG
eukprot:g40785.t1